MDLLRRQWGYMLYTDISVQSTLLEGYTANGSLGQVVHVLETIPLANQSTDTAHTMAITTIFRIPATLTDGVLAPLPHSLSTSSVSWLHLPRAVHGPCSHTRLGSPLPREVLKRLSDGTECNGLLKSVILVTSSQSPLRLHQAPVAQSVYPPKMALCLTGRPWARPAQAIQFH